jgi:glycosyltransferase involved in cell wall biosynthesis
MRIAILAPGLAYEAGAIPIRARLAGDLLTRRGHQVFGFGLELDGVERATADFPIETIHARKLPYPLASLTVWLSYELSLASRLVTLDKRCGGLDLVISHWQTYAITIAAIRRRTRARWASLVQRTIYDLMKSGHAGPNFVMNGLIVRGCRWEFTHSDVVVALHGPMAREIQEHVPQVRRIEILPNGVNIPADSYEELVSAKEPRLVLYAGRLDVEKCVDVLIQGFAESCHRDTRLVIVGDGAQRPNLERFASELGCAERVGFTGALPHADVLAWMKRASVFVLVSSSEGMPFVLLEAMAAGCAIVCSDISGSRAILNKEDARFVPVGASKAVAAELDCVLGSPLIMRDLGGRAFERAQRFDWQTIIGKEVRLYEGLVSPHMPTTAAQ